MADASEYGGTIQVTMRLFEGNFTRRDILTDVGSVKKGGTYAEERKKGDLVFVYTSSDLTVRGVAGDTSVKDLNVIGRVVTGPEGAMPNAKADDSALADGGVWTWSDGKVGERFATVEFFAGHVMRDVIIKEDPGPGVLVYHDGGGTFSTVSVNGAPSGSARWRMGILLESASSASTKSVLFF